MLVFTRRMGEKVVVNGDIIITAVDSERGNQIRFGIDAPSYVTIDRYEVHKRKASCKDSISELGLSKEINLLLANNDVYTVGELASLSFMDLLIMAGMSIQKAEAIVEAYKQYQRRSKVID